MVKATEIEKAIDAKRLMYQQDPVGFAVDVLGMRRDYIWHKMVEVAEAVRDHQKVCIRAGHNVSKTYGMGRIIVPWFKTCFLPSTVITTAPSDNQVRHQLWREIHAAWASAAVPLGGKMTSLGWDMKPTDDVLSEIPAEQRANWEKNFAIGFSTSPDTTAEHATKMQGWHNEWVLVVIDEACGMAPQIWRTAVQGLITDPQCKIVAIGNPTDPECEFAKACHSEDETKNNGKESYMSEKGWWVITIDARDNPNYQQQRRVIPGLASYEWVQSIIDEYGEDGDGTRYRVKGLFPRFREGTFYGDKLFDARITGRVGAYPHDPNYPVYTFSDFGDMYVASIYVQFIQGRIRIISDYWNPDGGGAPAWVAANNTRAQPPIGYNYLQHTAGPDLDPQTGSNKQSFMKGALVRTGLLELGYAVEACEKHDFDDGIRATREMWKLLEINEPECQDFLAAAGGYGKVKNLKLSTEDQPAYHKHPAQTWHCHMMDALRHLGVRYRIHRYSGDKLKQVYNYEPPMDASRGPWAKQKPLTGGLKSLHRQNRRPNGYQR